MASDGHCTLDACTHYSCYSWQPASKYWHTRHGTAAAKMRGRRLFFTKNCASFFLYIFIDTCNKHITLAMPAYSHHCIAFFKRDLYLERAHNPFCKTL